MEWVVGPRDCATGDARHVCVFLGLELGLEMMGLPTYHKDNQSASAALVHSGVCGYLIFLEYYCICNQAHEYWKFCDSIYLF